MAGRNYSAFAIWPWNIAEMTFLKKKCKQLWSAHSKRCRGTCNLPCQSTQHAGETWDYALVQVGDTDGCPASSGSSTLIRQHHCWRGCGQIFSHSMEPRLEIWQRMATNMLKLNDDKTEFMAIGWKHSSHNLPQIPFLQVGDNGIKGGPAVMNIGEMMDQMLSMHDHLKSVSKSSYMNLWNIYHSH